MTTGNIRALLMPCDTWWKAQIWSDIACTNPSRALPEA